MIVYYSPSIDSNMIKALKAIEGEFKIEFQKNTITSDFQIENSQFKFYIFQTEEDLKKISN